MTEQQGVFPLKLRSGSEHFLRCSGDPVTCVWVGRGWMIPGYTNLRTSDDLMTDGWTYLGLVPTHEQAQADAADARRFRWLVDNASVTRPIPNEHGGYTIAGRIFFETTTGPTIRAAIDAEMMERAMTDRHRPNHSRRKESIVIAAPERDWPAGCYDPTSCERHRMCMYHHCIHTGLGAALGDAIDAAMKGDSNE